MRAIYRPTQASHDPSAYRAQDIFYSRPDVLTVSVHRDPVDYYPFFWGYADQVGTEAWSRHRTSSFVSRRDAGVGASRRYR